MCREMKHSHTAECSIIIWLKTKFQYDVSTTQQPKANLKIH